MTRYSDEIIREMHERAKQEQKRLCPLQHRFKDKTIKEILEELESKNFLQESQATNK